MSTTDHVQMRTDERHAQVAGRHGSVPNVALAAIVAAAVSGCAGPQVHTSQGTASENREPAGFLGALFARTNAVQDSEPDAVAKEAGEFAAGQEEELRPFLEALYREGEWGAVLNLQQLGLAAMEVGRYDLARWSFDEAVTRIEAIYADDPNAQKAKSLFNEEKEKDFKGEPYERSMTYFYRGLLYAHEGDLQNARAAFLAADRHDTLSEQEEYQGDFGLMKYLAGWASYCDGDAVRGEQLVSEAQASDELARGLPRLPPKFLFLLDAGRAPVKYGEGQYREILKFKAAEEDSPNAPRLRKVSGVSSTVPVQLGADVLFQATTRGGRAIDGVMAGKARFKEGAGAVGEAAIGVGGALAMHGAMSGDRSTANVGFAGMLIGLIAKGMEAATTPAADVRAWSSLPSRIYVASGEALEDRFEYFNGGDFRPPNLVAMNSQCAIAWGRTQSAQASAYGGVATISASEPKESERGARNLAFRSMLRERFAQRVVAR